MRHYAHAQSCALYLQTPLSALPRTQRRDCCSFGPLSQWHMRWTVSIAIYRSGQSQIHGALEQRKRTSAPKAANDQRRSA